MEYFRVAIRADFTTQKVRTYSLLGKKVLLIQKDDGQFLAVEGACKHQGALLQTVPDQPLQAICPRHGWRYDLASGACLNHASAPLRQYAVKIVGEEIFLAPVPMDE